MAESFIPRVLIPAAGFGKRMGLPEAKEMLIGPEGTPLIEWSLSFCNKNGLKPLVISRPEKNSLNDYLRRIGVDTLLIEPSGEWPDTLLKSEELWAEKNLVLLPDTRFSPLEMALESLGSLD